MDWVIDTDVLVQADRFENDHEHWVNVSQLLANIRELQHSLVVDFDHKILGEYYSNLARSGWVVKWLGYLTARGQVRQVSGDLPNSIYRGLRSLKFDVDDDVFIGVTTRTTDKHLLAEESDYSPEVTSFLSDHGISVVDCVAACARIR